MKTSALITAIVYESKLIRRNWLFYLFILGLFAYTLVFLIPWEIHSITWEKIALASSLPLQGIFFLNLFQSLIITFIACDIPRKRHKAETRETLYTRPVGNGQLFFAGFSGMLLPFLIADIIFLGIILLINIVIPDSPVNPGIYLFYLLTHVLPSLVFICGLSLLVNRLFRHVLVSWVVLVAFLTLSFLYLQEALHGALDFRGTLLPDSFSGIIGFAHLQDYLLQRGLFLASGTGMLFIAPLLARRLPNTPGHASRFIVPAVIFLACAACLGFTYLENFSTRENNRETYRQTFLEHEKFPTARALTHDITYHPRGNTFKATSRMIVQNQKNMNLERVPLFLNPGLEVLQMLANGQDVPFTRDHQVILVDLPLARGDSVELTVEYGGCIDEYIYQVNILNEDFFAPISYVSWQNENYGKRTAFLSDRYTLLLPEVMWYPTTVAPVALQPAKETNFTAYTLHVEKPEGMTVLSQGIPTEEGDYISFRNLQNLTGLSLCIGDYHKRSFTTDSLTVEFYTYPGNDFYLSLFDGWLEEIAGYPDGEEYLPRVFQQCKDNIEAEQPNPYPFKLLKFIETPIPFLHDTPFGDNIQPELAFFGERIAWESEKPGDPRYWRSDESSLQECLLLEAFPYFLNNIRFGRIFSDYNRSITSDDYLGIDIIFNRILKPQENKLHLMPSRLKNVAAKGMEGIIKDGLSMEYNIGMPLKTSHLLAHLTTLTTWDSLQQYMREFSTLARFREISFDTFIGGFKQHFGQNIKPFIDEWYTTHDLPMLAIKDITHHATEDMQFIDFKVGNSCDTEGIVSVISYGASPLGEKVITNWRSFTIKPGEYKRIVVHEDIRHALELTTNFSGCLPDKIQFGIRPSSVSPEKVPAEGVTPLAQTDFYPPEEIIVDNEDENFRLIDSADNKLKLADLIKQDDLEYNTMFTINVKTNSWGIPVIAEDAHGEYVHSVFTKASGTGKFKAEWSATLPKEGKYEIFIHRPQTYSYYDGIYEYKVNAPDAKNYYTLYLPEGKEEIVLEVQENAPYWISLGTFTLPVGKSRIVLDDRGAAPSEDGQVQLIVADAVKWVKIK